MERRQFTAATRRLGLRISPFGLFSAEYYPPLNFSHSFTDQQDLEILRDVELEKGRSNLSRLPSDAYASYGFPIQEPIKS